MALIFNIAIICSGFLLGASALDKLDGASDIFFKIERLLYPFSAIFGGICLGLGVYFFLFHKGHVLFDLLGTVNGLLLLTYSLKNIPLVGDFLFKISQKLTPFKVGIGVSSLIWGILELF